MLNGTIRWKTIPTRTSGRDVDYYWEYHRRGHRYRRHLHLGNPGQNLDPRYGRAGRSVADFAMQRGEPYAIVCSRRT